jgi:hypothetical protein
VTKPSYSLAFNKSDNILPLNYECHVIIFFIFGQIYELALTW